jgi:hypothetical protein
VKTLGVIGLILFCLLFRYLVDQETRFRPRGSGDAQHQDTRIVHERYQPSYFSPQDAQLLRRLHREEAVVLLGIAACCAAVAYSKRKSGGQ